VKDFNGYTQGSFNNWRPQFKRFLAPLGFTMRNNHNKSVTVWLYSREISRNFNVEALAIKTVMFAYTTLKEKNVIIDMMEPKVKNLHISVKNDDLDKVFNKGETFEVLLNRPCSKIFKDDPEKEARAWTDESPYRGVETNDIKYKENLIMMPERIERMVNTVQAVNTNQQAFNSSIGKYNDSVVAFTKQINLHLGVLNSMSKNMAISNKNQLELNKSLNRMNGLLDILSKDQQRKIAERRVNELFENPNKMKEFNKLTEEEKSKFLFGQEV